MVALARIMRAAGVRVGSDRIALAARAAAAAPADLYWAGRVCMVSRREDLVVYHRAFEQTFGARPETRQAERRRQMVGGAPFDAVTGLERAGEAPRAAPASPVEVLRNTSFAACSPQELRELAVLMRRMSLRSPTRRSRRRTPARAGAPDMRRTLRRAFRTGGEALGWSWRRRRRRRRRLVLLVDMSGSMSAYSRGLLLFAHAALRTDARWEAFAFATRLTRLTSVFAEAGPDAALTLAAERAEDWDGGTRIGAAVSELLDDHSSAARGAVVVVLSDGLDVGDPALLAERMARLRRLAHRVVWLNPLKENPEYAPLARGMRAALPHVDHFASGHDLASLEALAAVITEL